MLPQLRGAPRDVLACIEKAVKAGTPEISFMEMSTRSGYSLPACQAAVTVLEKHHYIAVRRAGPGRSNSYAVIDDARRRAIAVAQLIGLVAE